VIRVNITQDALEDLNEGCLFYEAQDAGLGEYFSDSLKGDIEGLKVTGGIHRLAYKDYPSRASRACREGCTKVVEAVKSRKV
jgi:hypothetical protein